MTHEQTQARQGPGDRQAGAQVLVDVQVVVVVVVVAVAVAVVMMAVMHGVSGAGGFRFQDEIR